MAITKNLGKVVPEKGVDYYTEEEKQEFKQDIEQEFSQRVEATETDIANIQEVIGIDTDSYDSTKTYQAGDIVVHEGKYYRAIQTATGTWDSSKWEEINVRQELDEKEARIEKLEENNKLLISNFNSSNAVIEGSGQVTNALYWNAKVNRFGGGQVSQIHSTGAQMLDISYALAGYSVDANTGENIKNQYNGCGDNYIPCNPNTSYTFSANQIVGALRLSEYTDEKANIQRNQASNSDSLTITTTGNTHYLRWSILYSSSTTVTLDMMNASQLMLNEGLSALPYEPFTDGYATPTPEHEQPIKMLTGNVSVEESNSNLFSLNTRAASADWGSNCTRSFDNNKFIVKGTPNGTYGTHTVYCNLYKGITYKFSAKLIGTCPNANFVLRKLNQQPTICTGITLNASIMENTVTFTPTENHTNVTFLYQSFRTDSAYDCTFYFEICPINAPKKYEISEGKTYPLTLPEGMYLGDLGTASNFIFKNEKNSPYYNSELAENAFYWKKEWYKWNLNGTESIYIENSNRFSITTPTGYKPLKNASASSKTGIKSTHFIEITPNQSWSSKISGISTMNTNNNIVITTTGTADTVAGFKSWLAENLPEVCYKIATPVYEQITDSTLLSQLENLWNYMKTYKGQTNFIITGGDIAGKLDLDYYVDDRVEMKQDIEELKLAVLSQGNNV